ncbi:hypothetical protein KI387_030007, partial [Taxus chinensis]
MLEKGELTVDNPNAAPNQNLQIFKKPFPNHAPSSNQIGETSTHDTHTREVHAIFNEVPVASQLPHIPSIEEILARNPPSTSEPTVTVPSPIEEHPSSPTEESPTDIETISPLASPLSKPLPTIPPPPVEEHPLPPPPIEEHPLPPPPTEEHLSIPSLIEASPLSLPLIIDPVEIPFPLGEHSPLATQHPIDLLSALLPTEAEAGQFPISKMHFTGIPIRSSPISPTDVPFS